jgi:very-short-patch-repair endonuclease
MNYLKVGEFNIQLYNNAYCLNDIITQCELSKNIFEYIKKVKNKFLYNEKYYLNKTDTINLLEKTKALKSKILLSYIKDLNDIKLKYFYYNNIIYFKGRDIGKMLDYKDPCNAISLHVDDIDKIRYKQRFKNNLEDRETIFININGIKKLLMKSQKIYDKNIASFFGIEFDTRYLRKEIEIISYINEYLNENKIKFEFQKNINNYRIDLYLPEYKLAIEIDEFNHNDRNIENELIRENYIKNVLSCKFLRFNPDDKNFSIVKCLSNIINEIKNINNDINYHNNQKNNIIDIEICKNERDKIDYKKYLEKLKFDKYIRDIQHTEKIKELELKEHEFIIKELELKLKIEELKNNNKSTANNIINHASLQSNVINNVSSSSNELFNNVSSSSNEQFNCVSYENNKIDSDEISITPIKKCIDCNNNVSKKALRCNLCQQKLRIKTNLQSDTNRPTLDQLNKDLKELKSYVAVGKKYNVSDNAIRKWINSYKKILN